MILFTVPIIVAYYMIVETLEGTLWFLMEGARLLGSMVLWAFKRHLISRRLRRA